MKNKRILALGIAFSLTLAPLHVLAAEVEGIEVAGEAETAEETENIHDTEAAENMGNTGDDVQATEDTENTGEMDTAEGTEDKEIVEDTEPSADVETAGDMEDTGNTETAEGVGMESAEGTEDTEASEEAGNAVETEAPEEKISDEELENMGSLQIEENIFGEEVLPVMFREDIEIKVQTPVEITDFSSALPDEPVIYQTGDRIDLDNVELIDEPSAQAVM